MSDDTRTQWQADEEARIQAEQQAEAMRIRNPRLEEPMRSGENIVSYHITRFSFADEERGQLNVREQATRRRLGNAQANRNPGGQKEVQKLEAELAAIATRRIELQAIVDEAQRVWRNGDA